MRLAGWALLSMLAWLPISAGAADEEAVREPPPELSEEEVTEAFAEYDAALTSGDKRRAADALLPILADEALGAIHGQAWVKLGDQLASFDMEYSALLAYTRGIAADPEVGASKVSAAMDLAEKLGDDAILAPVLAANVGLDVVTATRSRMAYLAARHSVREGQYGVAQGILMMVDKDAAVFADAQALRGVVMNQQGQPTNALAPLLTAQQLGRQQDKGQRFDAMLELNLARSYYAVGNYPSAIEYYQNVPRESPFWAQGQFERAWAHFRMEDMSGTVAVLMTHDSPYLADWYMPEADLLRTYALYMLCKFPQANSEIEKFTERYTPLVQDIERFIAWTPEQAWADARQYINTGNSEIPSALLRRYSYEDRFRNAVDVVARADDELTRLGNVAANPFAAEARASLTERRNQVIAQEGNRILATVRSARDELKEMLQNVQITKLDMMEYETRLYERASATGELEFGDRIGRLRKLRKRRNTRVWPYQGEYWADEVGYFRIDSRPDCPESLQAGGGK